MRPARIAASSREVTRAAAGSARGLRPRIPAAISRLRRRSLLLEHDAVDRGVRKLGIVSLGVDLLDERLAVVLHPAEQWGEAAAGELEPESRELDDTFAVCAEPGCDEVHV